MRVRNLSKDDIIVHNNGGTIILPAGEVTKLDESVMTACELVSFYKHNVVLIPDIEIKKEIVEEVVEEVVEETKGNVGEEVLVNHEWEAKLQKARAYFEDLEQDNDSDKHAKLTIAKELVEEASKDNKNYDEVSLMEAVEEAFGKLPKVEEAKTEVKKDTKVKNKAEATKAKSTKATKGAKASKNK